MAKRDYLTVDDVTPEELTALLDGADKHKADRRPRTQLAGKTVALIFEKPSTRTRRRRTRPPGGHQREGVLGLVGIEERLYQILRRVDAARHPTRLHEGRHACSAIPRDEVEGQREHIRVQRRVPRPFAVHVEAGAEDRPLQRPPQPRDEAGRAQRRADALVPNAAQNRANDEMLAKSLARDCAGR